MVLFYHKTKAILRYAIVIVIWKYSEECRLLPGATAGAEIGNAPTEADSVEPEFFSKGGVRAEPGLQVSVLGLPVFPDGGGIPDGAGLGAKVINI